MPTERIDIVVTENNSPVIVRNLQNIGAAATQSANPVRQLQQALNSLNGGTAQVRQLTNATFSLRQVLQTLGVAVVAREIATLSQEYINAGNKLRIVTADSDNLRGVMNELYKASQESRASFTDTSRLYFRLAEATSTLGLSQRELIDFTRQLNMTIATSGSTNREVTQGLIQFTQALSLGKLSGQEFRSVMLELPAVARVLADQLTGGNIGALKQLAVQGKITTEAMIESFRRAEEQIRDRFGKVIPTVAQGWTVLRNSLVLYIGKADESLGISRGLANMMLTLAKHTEIAASAVVGLGVALGIAFAPTLLGGVVRLIAYLGTLGRLMVGGAFLGFAPLILGIAAALFFMRDSISLGIDKVTTLGDLMRAVWESAVTFMKPVIDLLKTMVTYLGEKIREALKDVSFAGFLRLTAITIDSFLGFFAGAAVAAAVFISNIPELAKNAFKTGFNVLIGVVEDFINTSTTMWRMLGIMPDIKLPRLKVEEARETFASVGEQAQAAFFETFNNQTIAQDGLNKILARAKEIGRLRVEEEKKAYLEGAGKASPKPPFSEREMERLRDQYRSLVNRYRPAEGALLNLAEAEKLLNDVVKAGITSREHANGLLETMKIDLQDVIDPYGALLRAVDREIEANQTNAAMHDIENKLRDDQHKLLLHGTVLSEKEIELLRQKYIAGQQSNLVASEERRIYDEFVQPQVTYVAGIAAINKMHREGILDATQFKMALLDIQLGGLQGKFDAETGFQRWLINLQKEALDTASVVESALTGAFSKTEDALVELVTTGKFNFKALAASILKDVAKIIIHQLILQAVLRITNSLLGAFGGGGGASAGGSYAFAGAGSMALGGPTEPMSPYRINEKGMPEVFSTGKDTYLMTGAKPGSIIPLTETSDVGGDTFYVNVSVDASGGGEPTTSKSGDANAMELGEILSMAIKKELVQQKRPGGLLTRP